MADTKSTGLGMVLPPEINLDNKGLAKAAGYMSVGMFPTHRVVAINFDDHGAIYYMSPLSARELAQSLLQAADKLSQ